MAGIAMNPPQLIDRALGYSDRLRHLQPGQREWSALAQAAIADTLSAIAIVMAEADRQIPTGMPEGWTIDTHQSQVRNRLWAYTLAGPDGARHDSRFQYASPGTALGAGIDKARKLAGQEGG